SGRRTLGAGRAALDRDRSRAGVWAPREGARLLFEKRVLLGEDGALSAGFAARALPDVHVHPVARTSLSRLGPDGRRKLRSAHQTERLRSRDRRADPFYRCTDGPRRLAVLNRSHTLSARAATRPPRRRPRLERRDR